MEVIAYLRTSTKRQNLGIEAQRDMVERWAISNKAVIVAEYVEQESGRKNNRKELTAAIEDAKKRGCTLLVAKIDRLSRNASFLFSLKDSGLNIAACDAPELNTISLGILATFAQYERERISERIKEAYAVKRMRGDKMGNIDNLTAEGRKKGQETMKKNAEIRNVVTMELISHYRNDKKFTYAAIADRLNNMKHRTPRNKSFSKATVKIMYDRYEKTV